MMYPSEIMHTLQTVWAGRENEPMILETDKTTTYGQFLALAKSFMDILPHNARIGLIMEHGAEMIAALFAILANDSTYIPAEPSFPQARIDFMMADAGADCVLTSSGLIPAPASSLSSSAPLAYILYTSGSTGKPKGVCVTPANIVHYVRAFQHEFHPGPADTMLQNSVCSFDIFTEEVFASLLSGARLAIPTNEEKQDIRTLMDFCSRMHTTILSGFPYLLEDINQLDSIPPSFRLFISGGDVLRASHISNLKEYDIEIWNTYGPSETTVCATYQRCDNIQPLPDETYPIGHPVLGTSIQILDKTLSPMPDGEIGEICISGNGVSAGYCGSRKKENEAFVHLDDGSVLYRSGDLGYVLPDGRLAFLHRKDSQVMILGKRVEPAEVETALANIDDITNAAVIANTDEKGLSYLTAFFTGKKLSPARLRQALKKFLPSYMIPQYFVWMPAFPLTASGKIDRRSLPIVLKEVL